jgi:hypothetical protein
VQFLCGKEANRTLTRRILRIGMPQLSDLQLTIAFTDSTLGADEKDAEVTRLLIKIRELAEVKKVYLVADTAQPQAEAPERILNQFLVGTLRAEIPLNSIWKVFDFLRQHLNGKATTLTLSLQNKVLTVDAQTPQDLERALKDCETFLIPLQDITPQLERSL